MAATKSRFIRWSFNCPQCGSKSRAQGDIDSSDLLYQCKNFYCGFIWKMVAEEEGSQDIVDKPYRCPDPNCQSQMTTITHIWYKDSLVKKYMRCTNHKCLKERRLFVIYKESLNTPGKYANTHTA